LGAYASISGVVDWLFARIRCAALLVFLLSSDIAAVLEATGKARSRAVTEIEKHLADPVNARSRLADLYRWGEATLEQMAANGFDEETLEFVADTVGRPRTGYYRQ
jgi:hypothetical protein